MQPDILAARNMVLTFFLYNEHDIKYPVKNTVFIERR